jgi:hypothetical protein
VLSVYEGNQDKVLHGSTLTKLDLTEICNELASDDPKLPAHVFHKYMDKLFDDVISNSGKQKFNDFWLEMNLYQKVFCSFLVFSGQTDNGGVYQFVFNRPQFLIAVQESFNELSIGSLVKDYDCVLNELNGNNVDKLAEIKSIFNNDSADFSSQWDAFVEGRGDLPSTEIIESYFYDKEFKEIFYKSVVGYINKNINYFLA